MGAAITLTVIGTLIFMGGVLLAILPLEGDFPGLIIGGFMVPFGALMMWGGAQQPKYIRKTRPETIVFDNDKGAVIMTMDRRQGPEAYIRYDEVRGLEVLKHVSGSGDDRRTTYYTLLRKKDGGEWYLDSFGSQRGAENFKDRLEQHIQWAAPFTATMPVALSPKIERKEGGGKTIIHWQNEVSMVTLAIVGIVISLIFGGIVMAVVSGHSGGASDAYFELAMLLVFGAVFGFVLSLLFRRIAKDANTRYAVAVDSQQLTYYEFSKKDGQMRNERALPLSAIQSIRYSFGSPNNLTAGIAILTQEDIQKADEKPSWKSIKSLFSGEGRPITLRIQALNPVECLQLENWLQALLARHGAQVA